MSEIKTYESLSIMPDIPWDFARFHQNNKNLIIFNNSTFIKKLYIEDCEINTLLKLCNFVLEGFNCHKKVLIDENEMYIYLLSKYLNEKDYKDPISYCRGLTPNKILDMYNQMANNLKRAHDVRFNPFDIKYSNYLVDSNGNPIFIDFDTSYYEEVQTCPQLNGRTMFNLDDFDLSELSNQEALNFHDKLLMLNMLLQSLSKCYDNSKENNVKQLEESLDNVLKMYLVDSAIINYIISITKEHQVISDDDYFSSTIIEPMINEGIMLKKTF